MHFIAFDMSLKESAEQYVDRWLMDDFFPDTRKQVTEWWASGMYEEIISRLSGRNRLAFGTAGLRARMGAGFDRMNALTVLQTSQGLVEFIAAAEISKQKKSSMPPKPTVIIGFDGRYTISISSKTKLPVFCLVG